MEEDDLLQQALERVGVRAEKRNAGPLTQFLASGLGGLGGQLAARALKLGWLGQGLLGLGGAGLGIVLASYRFRRDDGPLLSPLEPPQPR